MCVCQKHAWRGLFGGGGACTKKRVAFSLKGGDEIRTNYVTVRAAFLWYRGKIVRVFSKLLWAQNTPLRYTAGHKQRRRQYWVDAYCFFPVAYVTAKLLERGVEVPTSLKISVSWLALSKALLVSKSTTAVKFFLSIALTSMTDVSHECHFLLPLREQRYSRKRMYLLCN